MSRMICMYAAYWSRKRRQPGTGLLGGQRVGPVRLQQLGGLRRGQAAGRIDTEPLGDLVGSERVPPRLAALVLLSMVAVIEVACSSELLGDVVQRQIGLDVPAGGSAAWAASPRRAGPARRGSG